MIDRRTGLVVTRDVALRVTLSARFPSLTYRLYARIVNSQGDVVDMAQSVLSVGSWVSQSFELVVGDGILAGCGVQEVLAGSLSHDAYAQIALVGRDPGGVKFLPLVSGWFGGAVGIGWLEGSVRGREFSFGRAGQEFVVDPAVGVEWSYTHLRSTVLELVGVRALLTTAASAGNRFANVAIAPGGAGNVVVRSANAIAQIISQAVAYSYSVGLGAAAVQPVAAGPIYVPMGIGNMIQGDVLSSVTAGLAAGDQYSGVQVLFLETPV